MQRRSKMQSLLSFVLSPDNVRRLGRDDIPEVEKLTLKNTEYLFGNKCVYSHLKRRFLSLGIYNESDQLAGVLCLDVYPNIPAIPPWDWEYWIYNKYDVENIHTMTTLWIHYAVWDRRYTTLFIKPILQYVFLTYRPLEHVIMVCPPGISHLDFLDGYSTRVLPRDFFIAHKVQTLFIAEKNQFVAQYVIRRAVEEDNDDLVAIIPKVLEDTYGEYYISELLSNEESERQIIVAEFQGCAVGVLCFNEEVDYGLLNEEFELVPFNGLKKHNVADEVGKTQVSSGIFLPEPDSAEHLSYSVNEESAVEDIVKDEEENLSEDEFSLVNLSSSLILTFLYEDDELSDNMNLAESITSIESHFSAVVLNEEYQDHLYSAEKSDIEGDEKKPKRKDSKLEVEYPAFYGEPNAFVMEICTSVPDHENCLSLLFQAAFECFPDRDYIIVSFPTDSNPCYLTRHFVRVAPRPNSAFTHELYILHRNAILGNLWVRPSISEDIADISDLITSLIKPSVVEDTLKEAIDTPTSPYKAYTFMCEKQIIGAAVVSEEDDHEYLEINYNLEPWMDIRGNKFGSLGCLEQFLISPIFQKHITFFVRELHRLSNFYAFFYRLKRLDYMYTSRTLPIVNAISNMFPMLPNPVPEYSEQITDEYILPQSLLRRHHQPFGLYLSTLNLSSMIRVEVHQKIVVVGAGTTTIAFLESLLFGSNPKYYVNFTNVTVVSPHGISYHKQPSEIREMVFVNDGHLNRRYSESICLKTYVHVVTGVMSFINRKEKYIGLNDDTYIPYDYLFLLCGEQFQKPPVKKKEVIRKRSDFPQNVFIINTEADAGNAFNALKNLTSEQRQGSLVVFGHYLEALCCLAALLEFGVAGNNLVYVDPSSDHVPKLERHDHLTQFFNNSTVETAILDEILLKGVTIYQDFNFVEWHLDNKTNFITSAKFESKYKFVDIELSALFIYHSKAVSTRTFQAIARSGLVFNGRLIIDENYQTNDPAIYGAGPLTMYSKRYHAEHLMHKYYNAIEIGCNLGREIRKKLLPEKFWDPPVKIKRAHKPLVRHCRFPGNLHYLHISKPGEPVPLDVATIKCNYGRVLATGDCKKLEQKGYFRLHLNQFQKIETITCLTKFKLHVGNMIALWGKHEILLNHLLYRFDTSMIPDLFEFFDQPWAAALYHRSFPRILDEISEMFSISETSEGVKLIDEVQSRLEKNHWNPLTKMQIDEVEELVRDSNLIPAVEEKVVDFLHENYMYLPMYVNQLLIRWIVHQVAKSPLFIKALFLTSDSTDAATNMLVGSPVFLKRQSIKRESLYKY